MRAVELVTSSPMVVSQDRTACTTAGVSKMGSRCPVTGTHAPRGSLAIQPWLLVQVHLRTVYYVGITADGVVTSGALDGRLKTYALTSSTQPLLDIESPGPIRCVVDLRDPRTHAGVVAVGTLQSGTVPGCIVWWRVGEDGKVRLLGNAKHHKGAVTALAADAQFFYAASTDKNLSVVHRASGKVSVFVTSAFTSCKAGATPGKRGGLFLSGRGPCGGDGEAMQPCFFLYLPEVATQAHCSALEIPFRPPQAQPRKHGLNGGGNGTGYDSSGGGIAPVDEHCGPSSGSGSGSKKRQSCGPALSR